MTLRPASMASVALALSFTLAPLAGCAAEHIRPHVARERDYQAGRYESGASAISDGSIWPEGGRGLFADFRASRVGDLVRVKIDESASARGDAATETDRESSMSFGIPSFFGLTTALARAYPDLDADSLMSLVSESGFDASGQTARSSRVQASIAVRVKNVLPNGDFFVEGTKIIMINDEELHVYISGVIRPEDIEQDNSVRSSLIADAEVELTGRGTLTNNQQRGWLADLISQINPF